MMKFTLAILIVLTPSIAHAQPLDKLPQPPGALPLPPCPVKLDKLPKIDKATPELPEVVPMPKLKPIPPGAARIKVIVPSDAVVKVDGQLTTSKGRERSFITDTLKENATSVYVIECSALNYYDVKEVRVRIGDDVAVDFTKDAAAKESPATDKRITDLERGQVIIGAAVETLQQLRLAEKSAAYPTKP